MIFDRVVEVAFAGKGVDIKPVKDLRIVFTVEKHDGITFNIAAISIFNLPENTRKKLARPFPAGFPMIEPVITVTLKAGYKGQDIQIFVGDLLSATNIRNGPDWRTEMFFMSGYFASTISRSVASLADKTPAKTIINELLAPLKMSVNYTPAADKALNNKIATDFSTSSLSYRAASDFLSRYGLSFTIEEGGQILVYDSSKPRDPNTAQTSENTFTPGNGMIGTPQINRRGVTIRSLLRPRIRLFQKFFVESETISSTLIGGTGLPLGEYHVKNISHSGDNRGEEWFTEIEGAYFNLIDGVYGDSVV